VVGDPRQATFATNNATKNKKYKGSGIADWLDERNDMAEREPAALRRVALVALGAAASATTGQRMGTNLRRRRARTALFLQEVVGRASRTDRDRRARSPPPRA
jgi:hypothetical protein